MTSAHHVQPQVCSRKRYTGLLPPAAAAGWLQSQFAEHAPAAARPVLSVLRSMHRYALTLDGGASAAQQQLTVAVGDTTGFVFAGEASETHEARAGLHVCFQLLTGNQRPCTCRYVIAGVGCVGWGPLL